MNFVALDVETANPDRSSICQIGLVRFVEGKIVEEWSTLIDPEDDFGLKEMAIHGISPADVVGSPTFPEILEHLDRFLTGSVCCFHSSSSFDKICISCALEKYNLPSIDTTWLDSASLARRTWEEVAWRGYGLENVCKMIGYEFKHHDALEDAKASGQIILAAIEKTGLNINDWLIRVNKPIDSTKSYAESLKKDGNPEGDLYGEVIVFTGNFKISKGEAGTLAANLGCKVNPRVTKKTTILVVGKVDTTKTGGKEKTSNHRKAEDLIQKGQKIQIIGEEDFFSLVEY